MSRHFIQKNGVWIKVPIMRNKTNKNWVSASDVGRAAYCPHYLELKNKGASPSKEAVILRAKGEEKHDELNRQAEDPRCYIATYLYGPEDSRTNLLRSFRDRQLAHYKLGRIFIQIYYLVSPSLVLVAKKIPFVRAVSKSLVDSVVNKLQRREQDD